MARLPRKLLIGLSLPNAWQSYKVRDFHEVTTNFVHPRCKFSEANNSVREVYATHLGQLREKIANGKRTRALRHLLRKQEAIFWLQRF